MKAAMTTIKGYINHGNDKLPRINRTPQARLAFFRAYGLLKAGQNMHAPEVSALSPGFNSKDYGVRSDRYPVMVAWSEQFRAEQWADEHEDCTRLIDHKGWFSDADCSRVLRAFVFRLSRGRWGCGYADSDSGQRVYLLEVHSSARNAAVSADHEARYYAEQEQEYNQRWQDAHELRDDISNKEKSIKRLYALRNAGVDDDVRNELLEEIDELRDMRAKLAKEYADIDL